MEVKFYLDFGAYMPIKAHDMDAGYDLYAIENETIGIMRGATIETGVHVAIPERYCGLIIGRSGLNTKHGVFVPVGLVDAGYTGPIKVKLYNLGDEPYFIHVGDKIAQLVIVPIWQGALREVDEEYELGASERGNNGFGSTGR